MKEEKLQSFNMTNLAYAVRKVIKLPHKHTFDELKQYVQPRLDYLNGFGRKVRVYFLFEESYVEPEWKDMVAQHYLNTSYQVGSTAMRVHLFLTDTLSEVTAKKYAGCFTLRHIDEVRIMLSFIYPNWEITSFGSGSAHVMTYKKTVHIAGKELQFHTYPLFVQDNAVLRCAQACLVSMSKYLNEKFHYNRIQISGLSKAIHYKKVKLIPSWGLEPTQMLEILAYHNIPVRYSIFSNDEDIDLFFQIIDYTVESAIPVILGITIEDDNGRSGKHVIQIIGHTYPDGRKRYVIYDDSGYYIKSLGSKGFVRAVSRKQLESVLIKGKSCIIYPIHERVYVLLENVKARLKSVFTKIPMLVEMKKNELIDEGTARCFLADNREVKRFLVECVQNNEAAPATLVEEVKRIAAMDMPHYLWYCEMPIKGSSSRYLVFLANPTYNISTTKNIFINETIITCDKQFGLLNYDS